MQHVLGIDGGNSKTLAVVGTADGAILGTGAAGGSNHQSRGGVSAAMYEIRSAAERALGMAGIDPADVDAAYFCLAGADLPEDFELLRPALTDLNLARSIELNNDSMASLRSGTDNPNAVVVAVGAGTVGAGHNEQGQEIRLPALGWISGDWGGGGDLAREAVWYSARMHDGRGEPTKLLEMVLNALDVPDMDTLISRLYHRQVGHDRVRQLAPLVFEAAEAGDAVARGLIIRQGEEVATTAVALLRRLELLQTPSDVVLGGSIFRGQGTLLQDTIRKRLHALAPLARIVRPNVEPVVGAFFCAMDLLEIRVDDRIRGRAAETYRAVHTREPEEVSAP